MAGAGRAVALPGLAALLACSACSGSSSGPDDVFTVLTGYSNYGHAQVNEILDDSVPGLYNTTSAPVQLLSVQFAGVSPAVQILSVRAYSITKVGYGGISMQFGDLAVECRGQFVPAPITSFTVPPHHLTSWMVVIEYRITRPGTYQIGRIKITYRTNGRAGWQYQNLNDTFHVKNPPLPGPGPVPRTSVCGRP